MKNYIPIITILILMLSCELFAVKTVVIGFKDTDPKTEFITNAFNKYLEQNMTDAGFEILDDKVMGLELSLLKNKNFFLASKEYFEDFENMELDNSIRGEITYEGRSVYLNIEVYSREKRRLVLKGDMKGNKKSLLAFFNEATNTILSSMGSTQGAKNIFPIDNQLYFYKYLKLSYQADKMFETDEPDKYFTLMDELEALKDKFDEYPVFKDLYESMLAESENYEIPGVFDKPTSNVSVAENEDDNEIEKFARDIIVNGYLVQFAELIRVPVEDEPDLVNLTVAFDIKLKKSYLLKLKKEIKRREGNPHFTDMGRYFFSKNVSESEDFRDFILKQRIVLKFIDDNNEIIAEAEREVYSSDYSKGSYRHSKALPFPLTPRGPANPAFGIDNHTQLKFFFEDMKISDIKRVNRTEIEILFD